MPLTFADLRRRIRMRTGNKIDDPRAEMVLREKIEEIWLREDWSFRQKEGVLTTAAPIATGTVTLNVDKTKVDGTGTGWTSSVVGFKFRAANDNSYYTVTAVNVATQQLTLESAYATVAFTGSVYRLFKNLYAMPSDFKTMVSMSYWWRLGEGTPQGVDRYDARRSFTSTQPASFIYRGEDASGIEQVEISPVPSAAIAIHFVYRSKPPTWSDTLLVPLNETLLTYLSAADALYLLAVEEPTQAQGYIAIADKYQTLGQNALAEASWADTKLRGIQKSVRDEAGEGHFSDDYAVSHDINGPI